MVIYLTYTLGHLVLHRNTFSVDGSGIQIILNNDTSYLPYVLEKERIHLYLSVKECS